MAMDPYKVQIWAKTDPFLIGALQFPPPAKFNMHYLRKMATYVRTRSAEGSYPRLSWAMWRHIACGKLQLVEDTAWLYFEAFHSLTERSAHKSLEWAEQVSSCSSVDEYEKVKSKVMLKQWHPSAAGQPSPPTPHHRPSRTGICLLFLCQAPL